MTNGSAVITIAIPDDVLEAIAARAAEIVAEAMSTTVPTSPWLYGAREAAAYLGMPLGRVEKLQATGGIPAHRVGERRYAYHRDELDRWIRASGS